MAQISLALPLICLFLDSDGNNFPDFAIDFSYSSFQWQKFIWLYHRILSFSILMVKYTLKLPYILSLLHSDGKLLSRIPSDEQFFLSDGNISLKYYLASIFPLKW